MHLLHNDNKIFSVIYFNNSLQLCSLLFQLFSMFYLHFKLENRSYLTVSCVSFVFDAKRHSKTPPSFVHWEGKTSWRDGPVLFLNSLRLFWSDSPLFFFPHWVLVIVTKKCFTASRDQRHHLLWPGRFTFCVSWPRTPPRLPAVSSTRWTFGKSSRRNGSEFAHFVWAAGPAARWIPIPSE